MPLTTVQATEEEQRVATALIEASKAPLRGDEYWLAMARAAIAAMQKK